MGKDIPDMASTICLILFFGGLITAVLSVMGEYIGGWRKRREDLYIYRKGKAISMKIKVKAVLEDTS